ncbi:MAG: hypothetical protein ABI670_21095 [Chloroflexota bacterium]
MSKQRYEQEIEEILKKYDEQAGRKDRPTGKPPVETTPVPVDYRAGGSRRVPQKSGFSMPSWKRISSGQYLLLAFGVALLAVLLRNVLGSLTVVLIVLSAVLFLIPIFLYRSTGTTGGGYSANEEKRWRGQPIDINTRREISGDPLDSIKRWFKRK